MDPIVINEDFQPGNGTRYDIQLVRDSNGFITITWLLYGGVGGTSFRFNNGARIKGMENHLGYFMEKMDLRHKGDATALIQRAQRFNEETAVTAD